ncbi:MAG: hypothetical protein V1721_02175, partial [Pseudomonadota bacterium]
MATGKEKLQLKSDNSGLVIPEGSWKKALETAIPDPVVHIRHAAIEGTARYRTHVAAIPTEVGCH